jgi:hypothetical protein
MVSSWDIFPRSEVAIYRELEAQIVNRRPKLEIQDHLRSSTLKQPDYPDATLLV